MLTVRVDEMAFHANRLTTLEAVHGSGSMQRHAAAVAVLLLDGGIAKNPGVLNFRVFHNADQTVIFLVVRKVRLSGTVRVRGRGQVLTRRIRRRGGAFRRETALAGSWRGAAGLAVVCRTMPSSRLVTAADSAAAGLAAGMAACLGGW